MIDYYEPTGKEPTVIAECSFCNTLFNVLEDERCFHCGTSVASRVWISEEVNIKENR